MSKVLVCEDEDHIRRLIQVVLEKSGHEVYVAADGLKGLEMLEEGIEPDLIMLDIMMPGMDGLQVLQRLKADPETRAIPVVLLTALAQENVVVQGIKLGAKDYVRKPFHPKDLMTRLSKYLDGPNTSSD